VSRASLAIFLLALVAGAGPVFAMAKPRLDREQHASVAAQPLVLPKRAIAAAVRRTAVADPDLDDEVTKGEARQYYETRFALLDENRDGVVDGVEFVRAVVVRSLYTVDGFAQARPLAFESIDVDGDGRLTPEEFLRAQLLRRTATAVGGLDARRRAIFELVDHDGDGVLSREEFMDAGLRDFLASDADGDGKVSVWEFYSATRL